MRRRLTFIRRVGVAAAAAAAAGTRWHGSPRQHRCHPVPANRHGTRARLSRTLELGCTARAAARTKKTRAHTHKRLPPFFPPHSATSFFGKFRETARRLVYRDDYRVFVLYHYSIFPSFVFYDLAQLSTDYCVFKGVVARILFGRIIF